MKQTICEETINTFLELDRNEHLGFKTTLHLFTCKKCRTVVRLCTLADRSSSRPLRIPETINHSVTKIVQTVNPSLDLLKDSSVKPVSMSRWVLSGFMLILTLVLFASFSMDIKSPILQTTIYLLLSAFICIYCAFFIGSNLDFFVKKIDTVQHSFEKKAGSE